VPSARGHAINQPRGQSLTRTDFRLTWSHTFTMPRHHKPKQPRDTPISTPTSPADLIQNLTPLPRGDSRALATSSTAIALSISSAFFSTAGPHDTSGDGAAVQGRDTGWQTAYAAVRMAVETIKESSDLCLPLKAVVGAVSVLMKNYDVSMSCLRTGYLLILYPLPPSKPWIM